MKTYVMLAERIQENNLTIDCRRPVKLYRYASARWLERALKLGEFRLRPAADYNDLITETRRGR
jgi:hypothetical protein